MPGFHRSVAVLPLPFRRCRYVNSVRITLLTWKIPLRRCHFHLPLRRNRRTVAIGSNPIFAVLAYRWTTNQAFWSLHPCVYVKTFPAFLFSRATATVATERKNGNDTTERHNGTTERQNGNGIVETTEA